MEHLWKSLGERWQALGAGWVGSSAFGSFLLYLLGYLVTRFQLTMLGVGTNLDILEERYFFAGAKFAVYLLATVPTLVLLLLVPAGLCWLLFRLLPLRKREAAAARIRTVRPAIFFGTGIVVAVVMIQFVARQCFALNNLLLAESVAGPAWLQAVLLDDTETLPPLFFAGLVAATGVTACCLIAGRQRTTPSTAARIPEVLLAVLLTVQVLLLPVNYSMLVAHKFFPRVVESGAASEDRSAWLVWENNESATYFVARAGAPKTGRELVTVDRKESKEKNRIVGYDPLLRMIFPQSP